MLKDNKANQNESKETDIIYRIMQTRTKQLLLFNWRAVIIHNHDKYKYTTIQYIRYKNK